MRNLGFGLVVSALGCGTASAPPSEAPATAQADRPFVDAAPLALPDDAREEAAGPEPPGEPAEPPPAAAAPACSATIGLDVRALPTNAGPQGINMFVLAQGDRIRRLAPPGVEVEIRHIPGMGCLIPVFRAATADEAEAVCRAVIAEYLEHAPRVPVIMQSAASLASPCGPWSAPPDAAPPAD